MDGFSESREEGLERESKEGKLNGVDIDGTGTARKF